MLRFFLSAIGTCIFLLIQAQSASVQDCLGAIPICQQVYHGGQIPEGNGNIEDFAPDNTCLIREASSIWYTFTVNNSGRFGFLLTPSDSDEDFDWVLFDISDANCEDLFNNPSLMVSCNAAGGSGCFGPTGAIRDQGYNIQGPGCFNSDPDIDLGNNSINELIDVQAGNTYALCISNFTRTSQAYTLDFGYSEDIGIFDETPPTLDEVTYPDSCSGMEMSVRFSEYIQCSTINASNFQLSGAGESYTLTLSSVNCDAGGNYSKEFLLAVDPPIPANSVMNLDLIVDGSTEVLDLCDNPGVSANLSFEGPALSEPLNLGLDTTICEGASILLGSDLPGSYSWSDGSNGPTLEVSESGIYWLTINTPVCGRLRDTIAISVFSDNLSGAILGNDTTLCLSDILVLDATTPGSVYLWHDGSTAPTFSVNQTGAYAVTVTNECGETQDEINVDFVDPITPELSDADICPGESVNFDVSTPGAAYLWQDGATTATYTTTTPGTYSVTISNACEAVELSAEVQETAGSLPDVNLGNDTTLCPGANLLLTLNIPDVSFLWQDGSANSSFLVTQTGTYAVTVTNECGEAQDEINVDFAGPIIAQLSDASLCPGESVNFDVTTAGASYVWQDGSTNSTYTATAPGTYSVTVSNACQVVELSAEAQEATASLPDIDLGSDAALCPGESLILELDIPGVSYLWQDGTEADNYQVTSAGTYSVSVSSECESRSDSIQVDFLEPITVHLVQDTILCPGENLLLDVTDENASSYSWQDNSSEPVYRVEQPGTYTVLVGNPCEEVTLSVNIEACEICNVYVPNTFSPNGDGNNDFFRPYLNCLIEDFNLKIFNRWGILVFETTSIENGWDGTFKGQMANNGVYIYVLQLSALENGETRYLDLSGDITVIK